MPICAIRYGIVVGALALACYVVVFYGFDAVVKGVMLQITAESGEHLRGAKRAPTLVVPSL